MRWRLLFATGLAILAIAGCTTQHPATHETEGPTSAETPAHPELTAPIEAAVGALNKMGEASTDHLDQAKAAFAEYRTHWAKVKAELEKLDPGLTQHMEDGAIELDLEFAKPPADFRAWEIPEERVKLTRLLGRAATLLGAPLPPGLIPPDPVAAVPFNAEQRIVITLSEHRIEPAHLTLPQHTKVTFVITNRGKEVHEWELGHFGVDLPELAPGATKEVTLVLLDDGEWEMACHMPGHYEVGMFGSITVTPEQLKK
jgi:plastocyanin